MNENDPAIRLAQLRGKKGVSARDMSLSIGQNPGYINNIETGKAKRPHSKVFLLYVYLRITPSEFFDIDVPNPSKLDAIIKDMKKLNDQQLEIISALVKDLIKK